MPRSANVATCTSAPLGIVQLNGPLSSTTLPAFVCTVPLASIVRCLGSTAIVAAAAACARVPAAAPALAPAGTIARPFTRTGPCVR